MKSVLRNLPANSLTRDVRETDANLLNLLKISLVFFNVHVRFFA